MLSSFNQPQHKKKGVLFAGSLVILDSSSGSMIVIYNRNDYSGHNNTPPHDNFDIAMGPSGGEVKGIHRRYYINFHQTKY